MPRFCSSCGTPVPDNASSCPACRQPVAVSVGGGAAVAPAPAQADAPSSGLADNLAGALAYITIIPAIIFLVAAPYNQNKFVKFHALQSLGLHLGVFVLYVGVM